jgi:uncharacterized protein YjiS (DUF1127 family)
MFLMSIVNGFRFSDRDRVAMLGLRRTHEERSMTPRTLATHTAVWIWAWRDHGLLGRLRSMLHAIESRRHLAEMDARMLSDIGISRCEALEEAARAPWDLMPRRR